MQKCSPLRSLVSDLDKATQAIIDHGQRVRALLIQPQYESRSLVNQILMLFSLKYGFVKEIPVAGIANYMQAMLDAMHAQHANLVEMLASEKEITPALETALKERSAGLHDSIFEDGGITYGWQYAAHQAPDALS